MKQLIFTPHGGAQLLQSAKDGAKVLWSSDDDTEFMEEFGDDVIDPDSEEDLQTLTDWLIEIEHLHEDEEFESASQYIDEHSGEVMYVGDDDEGDSDE